MTTSRPRVRVTAPARRDLREVLQVSARTWGGVQRDADAAALNEGVRRLGEYPLLGRRRDDLRSGLRSAVVGQHVVLYQVDGDEVVVLRVVHGRRDLSRVALP